jgi:lipid-binding SYLF domain-containing protein
MTFESSPYGGPIRHALFRHALAALLALGLIAGPASGAWAQDRDKADKLIRTATTSVRNFLVNPKWQAVRNLLGGARAIFIVPHDVQGGFLLTASGGEGVLLRRHGDQWSDPIFLHIGGVGLGFEAGGEDESFAMVIMTDAGVDQLIDGVVRLGGSGGFALADLGVEGAGAGSIGSGIEVLSVATTKGLFAGSGIQGTKLWPGESYNSAVYGPGSNLAAIANGRGGQVSSASELRTELAKAVIEAWGK